MMLDAIKTFSRIQFKRHLANPMLWFVALAAPIAAKYMVPSQNDGYTVLSINSAYPILTPSVIGMELGIISALLLSPLVYIFLRVGRTKHTPWQIEDISPAPRSLQMFGHWIADTAIIWLLLFGLAVSGVILSAFRLPLYAIRPLETIAALLIIACPAFAFIAALRIFFSARPLLRGALGDFGFVIVWVFTIAIGALTVETGGTGFADMFGYAAPIIHAVDEPVEMFAVGSTPGAHETLIQVDALKGILRQEFLASRLFWFTVAAAIALFAGLVFKGRKPKAAHKRRQIAFVQNASNSVEKSLARLIPKGSKSLAPLWSNMVQALRPGSLALIMIGAAIAGAVLPFRSLIAPALWLGTLFMFTRHSAMWENRQLNQFMSTVPTGRTTQQIWQIVSFILIMTLLCLPSLIRMALACDYSHIIDMVFLCFALPVIISLLGRLTQSGTTARLLLLIVWYMYLNL